MELKKFKDKKIKSFFENNEITYFQKIDFLELMFLDDYIKDEVKYRIKTISDYKKLEAAAYFHGIDSKIKNSQLESSNRIDLENEEAKPSIDIIREYENEEKESEPRNKDRKEIKLSFWKKKTNIIWIGAAASLGIITGLRLGEYLKFNHGNKVNYSSIKKENEELKSNFLQLQDSFQRITKNYTSNIANLESENEILKVNNKSISKGQDEFSSVKDNHNYDTDNRYKFNPNSEMKIELYATRGAGNCVYFSENMSSTNLKLKTNKTLFKNTTDNRIKLVIEDNLGNIKFEKTFEKEQDISIPELTETGLYYCFLSISGTNCAIFRIVCTL